MRHTKVFLLLLLIICAGTARLTSSTLLRLGMEGMGLRYALGTLAAYLVLIAGLVAVAHASRLRKRKAEEGVPSEAPESWKRRETRFDMSDVFNFFDVLSEGGLVCAALATSTIDAARTEAERAALRPRAFWANWMLARAVLRRVMQFQHRSGPRYRRTATWSLRVLALGSLTLGANCNGMLRDPGEAASGGTLAIGGASALGGTAASGGTTVSGGAPATIDGAGGSAGSSDDLGAAGSAGAPALPACGCSDDGAITVAFPEGSRVYRRLGAERYGCNPLTCVPEAPYAAVEGAHSFRLDMRACDEDGECIVVQTGSLEDGVSQGEVILATDGRETLREPATVVTTRFLDAQEPRVEFTFQTDSAENSILGSGRVCWATSQYTCLF